MTRPDRSTLRRIAPAVALGTALAGCAHYTALPMPVGASLAPEVAGLHAAPASGQSLTIAAIVHLALANNPDLRATRARHGVAQAQFLQAVLLPNPSVGAAILPLLSGASVVPAWNVALSADVKALVTYRSRRRGATAAAAQVDAEILWQEWQVAGQTRQIAVELIASEATRPLLQVAFNLLQGRNTVLQAALAAGNVTLVTAAPTLVALQNARAALHALDQRQLGLRHQLNAVLALTPDAVLPLATTPDLPPFDAAAIRVGLATLPARRPDLLALRLGNVGEVTGWVVPHRAVVTATGPTHVFQVVTGKARAVPVAVRLAGDQDDIVDGPLDATRPVIVDGAYQVSNGDAVRATPPR